MMGIAEGVLAVLLESLQLVDKQLGSKLERDLRDIIKRDKEGREELALAMSLKYPDYNDYDVKAAENKIYTAKHDYEVFKKSYIDMMSKLLEAKK